MSAIERLIRPRSIAVIGASADPGKTSGRPISYLQKHGKLKGTWLAADQKIQRYIREADDGKNADGSFDHDNALTGDDRLVHRKRKLLHRDFVHLAGEERFVILQRSACDGALDQRPRARAVFEEGARPEPAILRLVVHVLSAPGDHEKGQGTRDKGQGAEPPRA